MLVYPQEMSSDFMGYLLFFGTPHIVDYKQVLVFLSPSSETRERRKRPLLNTFITQMKLNQHRLSGLTCKALHRVFAAPTCHIFVCYFSLLVL